MKHIIYFLVLCIYTVMAGCNVFFEEDISDKELNFISPTNNLQTKITTMTFSWVGMEGATNYELQIAAPNFNEIEKMLLDTIITFDYYSFSLIPGSYEWRVRGINSAYSTQYFSRKLEILNDTAIDLTIQTVKIVSPTDNYFTKQQTFRLKWVLLNNATHYNIEIRTPDWNGTAISPYNYYVTTSDTLTVKLKAGSYAWGVRASNEKSFTVYTHQRFMIDTIAPEAPTELQPESGTKLTSWPVKLSWSRKVGSGSPIEYDSIWLAKDSTFVSNVIVKRARVDASTYSVENLGSFGTYYWRIKSIDKAGNIGNVSVFKRFSVVSN